MARRRRRRPPAPSEHSLHLLCARNARRTRSGLPQVLPFIKLVPMALWLPLAHLSAAVDVQIQVNSMYLCMIAGEYSSEKLSQLRQQTKSMPGAAAVAKPLHAAGGFKLSGSFKAAKKPADDRYEVNASDMVRCCSRRALAVLPNSRG